MSKFNVGDRVLVNNGTIATITSYDENTGLVSYVVNLSGGGTDTHTRHIIQTTLEVLPELPFDDASPE